MRITEDVGRSVKVGLAVYDQDGDELGYIDQAEPARGWMEVRAGALRVKRLWIPYRLVKSVDEREVILSATTGDPVRDFATRPARKTTVAQVGGRTIAFTTEPSGYDSEPVRVHQVDVNEVKQLLAVAQRIWTADDVELGTVKEFDATGHYLVVEKGALARKHDLVVPVVLVADVDRDAMEATLAINDADLKRMQSHEPVDAVIDLPAYGRR